MKLLRKFKKKEFFFWGGGRVGGGGVQGGCEWKSEAFVKIHWRTGLMVRASDSRSGDPGSILGWVGVLFP